MVEHMSTHNRKFAFLNAVTIYAFDLVAMLMSREINGTRIRTNKKNLTQHNVKTEKIDIHHKQHKITNITHT